jgi:hypothetical protein
MPLFKVPVKHVMIRHRSSAGNICVSHSVSQNSVSANSVSRHPPLETGSDDILHAFRRTVVSGPRSLFSDPELAVL